MKILISTYSFNPSIGQVTLSGYSNIVLSNLLLITNTTSGSIIYNFADPTLGALITGSSNNIVGLYTNTTTMSSTDKLQIYYDDGNLPSTENTVQLLKSQNDFLRRAVKVLESQGSVDSSNRQRITIDASPATVPTSLTSTTITAVPANTPVASSLTAQSGNSFPSSTNPYTLTSIGALVVTEYPIGQHWRMADSARNTYATSIRTRTI